MAADVEEAAQYVVVAAHDDDRFAGDFRGDVLPGLAQLIDAADHLPGIAKDSLHFEFVKVVRPCTTTRE